MAAAACGIPAVTTRLRNIHGPSRHRVEDKQDLFTEHSWAMMETLDGWLQPVVDPETRAHVYSLVNAVRSYANLGQSPLQLICQLGWW